MYNRNQGQLILGEDLLYQNLPEDILAKLDRLINWERFERILAKLPPSSVGRPAYTIF